MGEHDHLSATDLATFVASGLASEARTAAEAHLSTCRACRRALVAAHDASAPHPDTPPLPARVDARVRGLVADQTTRWQPRPEPIDVSRPHWPPYLAAAALLAALAGWAVLGPDRQGVDAPSTVVRSGAPLSPALTLIEPPTPAPSSGPSLGSPPQAAAWRFRWSGVSEVRGYTVTVLDARGDIVVTAQTSEREIDLTWEAPAPTVAQTTETTHYWYVCAQQTDGNEACSPVGQFAVE